MSIKTNVYFIHENGGRPYKVAIDKFNNKNNTKLFNVNVYKLHNDTEYEMKPILTFRPKKIFIGKSPLIQMTEYSGGHGSKFNGNSILLYIDDNTYVHIGSSIFSFVTYGKMVTYFSPVGNNDTPYPYGIDEYGNIYLLLEDVVIKNNNIVSHNMQQYDDPYSYYYDYYLITPHIGRNPVQKTKIKNFDGIKKFLIDKEEIVLSYSPFPKKNYDRLIPKYGKNMYIVNIKGEKAIVLTKETYTQIMKSFGIAQSFEPLKKKKILYRRSKR